MVSNNAWNSQDPAQVAKGGTGRATLTDHGVLVGAGTSAITQLSVGGTGTLLVGAAAADPAFATSATGDFTFTSSTAGATRTLTVSNTDNTNAASKALIVASTGGASSGDAVYQASTTTTTWSWGADNSPTVPSADPWVLAQGTALGTNNVIVAATGGQVLKPLQPLFYGSLPTDDANATGNGANYTLGTVTALTEVIDQGGNFNTNGTFTAPVAGNYCFIVKFGVTSVTAAMTAGSFILTTTSRSFSFAVINWGAVRNGSNAVELTGQTVASMAAGDTATTLIVLTGGAGNTASVRGVAASQDRTYFCGWLEC